jgi:hypothetical protein
MRVELVDGSSIHLLSLVKTKNYRQCYAEVPNDPVGEILSIARGFIPPNWPSVRDVPLSLIGLTEEELRQYRWRPRSLTERVTELRRTLPAILVVSEFYSMRPEMRTAFRRFVWLQDDLDVDITSPNLVALQRFRWD